MKHLSVKNNGKQAFPLTPEGEEAAWKYAKLGGDVDFYPSKRLLIVRPFRATSFTPLERIKHA